MCSKYIATEKNENVALRLSYGQGHQEGWGGPGQI